MDLNSEHQEATLKRVNLIILTALPQQSIVMCEHKIVLMISLAKLAMLCIFLSVPECSEEQIKTLRAVFLYKGLRLQSSVLDEELFQ